MPDKAMPPVWVAPTAAGDCDGGRAGQPFHASMQLYHEKPDFTIPLPEVIRHLDFDLFEDLRRAGLMAQTRHWAARR